MQLCRMSGKSVSSEQIVNILMNEEECDDDGVDIFEEECSDVDFIEVDDVSEDVVDVGSDVDNEN